MRSLQLKVAGAASLALVATASFAIAEEVQQVGSPGWGIGTPVEEADLAAWDIAIRTPDGANLPEGQGTVAEGLEIYETRCMHCHGPNAEGGPDYMFGTMVGGINSFLTDRRILTPGSMYPYAPILFDYIRRTMPMDAPQSLEPDEVYAVSAYLLYLNGLIEEDEVMNAETMVAIEMPNRDGFIEDTRPDTEAVRCLRDCEIEITFHPDF